MKKHAFLFIAVPYYDENSLDYSLRRRDNKELNIHFQAPYSAFGEASKAGGESANSSKFFLHSVQGYYHNYSSWFSSGADIYDSQMGTHFPLLVDLYLWSCG